MKVSLPAWIMKHMIPCHSQILLAHCLNVPHIQYSMTTSMFRYRWRLYFILLPPAGCQKVQKGDGASREGRTKTLWRPKRAGKGESILLSQTPIRKVTATVNSDSVLWNWKWSNFYYLYSLLTCLGIICLTITPAFSMYVSIVSSVSVQWWCYNQPPSSVYQKVQKEIRLLQGVEPKVLTVQKEFCRGESILLN